MIPFTTNADQKVKVYESAANMKANGLSTEFSSDAVEMALAYEGSHDLMVMWAEEKEQKERDEIIADIQEVIDDSKESPKTPLKKPYVRFDDLDKIASDVVKFKKALRDAVDRWGGISKLAKETGIPQPSLSRFFSSASMPRRTTLYKIADALKLTEDKIILDWVA